MQIDELIKNYYKNKNLECPNIYCKDCGKLLIYDGAKIGFQKRNGRFKDTKKGDIISSGITFLSTLEYEGNIYHLQRCKECVAKKFPNIINLKFLYAQKAAYYTQYAYDVPDEIFNVYTKKRQSITRDKMIAKWGYDDGMKKWNQYCQKEANSNTFEYKHEKYGMSIEEFKEYNKSRACTVETFKKRYGEDEGIKRWKQYCDQQRYTTSLEYFVKRYGKDEGIKKYIDFDNKRIQFGGSSKIANEFFDELYKNDIFKNHVVFYENLNNEYCIGPYRVDFYDQTINTVIEFYGDLWHANPLIYKPEDEIKVYKNVKVSDIWKHDKERQKYIMDKLNCKFLIVWENDVKNRRQEIISLLINQL